MSAFWKLFEAEPAAQNYNLPVWNLFSEPQSVVSQEDHRLRTRADSFFWGMQNIPAVEATKHLLCCGAIGSGKTSAIKLFLQSIARRFQNPNSPEQLIVFDAKGDMVPFLAGLGFDPEGENFWILNPFDKRGAVWQLGDLAKTPLMARRLATLLIPEEKKSSAPYFSDGARELIYSVILGLNRLTGTNWTLRDLLCALESVERIPKIARHRPRAKILATRILNDEKHCFGVLSTLGTKLGIFEQVAALWHYKFEARKFNLESFLSKPGVLVLPNDPALHDSLWPINAMLLRAITQEILRRNETRTPNIWFILDEFRAMQNVECIHDLLNRGRSKGASLLLGIQSIEGISEVYGEEAANDILSQCGYKTFLRVGGPKTAEWAERFFGKVRRTERVYTESWNGDKAGYSIQHSVQERSLFGASYFLNLPFPSVGGIYSCVSDLPNTGETRIVKVPFDAVISATKRDAPVPAVIPEDDVAAQEFTPWTEDEERFFCGDVNTPQKEPVLPTRSERIE